MNWTMWAAIKCLAMFFAAWISRTRNRRRNVWPTQGLLEQMRMGQRSRDKFDEEQAFLQAAMQANLGYTRAIKGTFLVGVVLIVLSFFIGDARAESIEVKFAGAVDLDSYACETITRSSLVNRVCYDQPAGSMIVLLRDTYYVYCSVPAVLVTEWKAAESMGRFYNQRIKSDAVQGLYACQ